MDAKEKNQLKCRVYYANNKERIKEIRKGKSSAYYQANKDKVNRKAKEKRDSDSSARELHKLRSALNKCIHRDSTRSKYLEIFGVSSSHELRKHFEKLFKKNMSWDNYGGKHGWQIDHIIPCCEFNFTDPKQVRRCFNIVNMRPVWAHENRQNYFDYTKVKIKEFNEYFAIEFQMSVFCPHCGKKVNFQFNESRERNYLDGEEIYHNCPKCKELFGTKYNPE